MDCTHGSPAVKLKFLVGVLLLESSRRHKYMSAVYCRSRADDSMTRDIFLIGVESVTQ